AGRARRLHERLERAVGARARLGILEQTRGLAVRERDAVQVVGELLAVEVRIEVAFLDRGARGVRQRLEPVALALDDEVAGRAGPVVELGRGGHEGTAPGQAGRGLPLHPALEERADAPLAPRGSERRLDDLVDEASRGHLQHLNLKILLRLEVREEPALRQLEVVGEPADRQPLEADFRGQAERVHQDGLAGLLALPHGQKIVRSFDPVKPYFGVTAPPGRSEGWGVWGAMFGAPPGAQTGLRGASRLRRDAPKAGGFGGAMFGAPPAQTGRRGASRLRRDAPKAGGLGGRSRG